MEATREQQILDKLERVLTQGRENAESQRLMRQMLFGAEEDAFQDGRLPRLEKRMAAIERQQEMEKEDREQTTGQRTILRVALTWLGKAAIVALSALAGGLLRAPGKH